MTLNSVASGEIFLFIMSVVSVIFYAFSSGFAVVPNLPTLVYSAVLALFAGGSVISAILALRQASVVTVSIFQNSGMIAIAYIFGYNIVPDEWYFAYMNRWKSRYNFEIKKEWLIFCTGVVPAVSSIVRKLTTPAENVLLLTPVYNIFFNSIVNNGRNVLECRLKYDGERYEIDFDDLENKLSNPQTTMMIFCNPHNPIGKIWSKET